MSGQDPRWQWIEVTAIGDPGPVYVRGPCNHVEPVAVRSVVDGALVAWLCTDCDAQLPAGWRSA